MIFPQKTTIDWLRFRAQAEPKQAIEALKPMFEGVGDFLTLKPLNRGILGFMQGANICIADMPVGRMDFGGESQRGWVRVELNGKGCEWVKDWPAAQEIEKLPSAEVRRLDIALTTWEGEITHEQVVQAHASGRFTIRRPPTLTQITSTDPRAGRTCYIGKREQSDKFFRAYEKGFELCGKSSGVTAINGHAIENIYRCEVEFKANATPIPWEVIERRDQYFAGSYPFCADVLPGVEADILMRRPDRAPQADLAFALENCRIQYGPTLFTALAAYGGDMTAIWDKIMGDHHSQALLESGVLLVDHE